MKVCRADFIIIFILWSLFIHACLWARSHTVFNFILFSLFDILMKSSFKINRARNLLHVTYFANAAIRDQWSNGLVIAAELGIVL